MNGVLSSHKNHQKIGLYKTKKDKSLVNQIDLKEICPVRQDIEILNLWEDFKKVVKFIDENFEWLNPLMEHITKKKLSLE